MVCWPANATLRALLVPREVPQAPEPTAKEAKPAECEPNGAHHWPVRLTWAKLPKRVFDLDLAHVPNCVGALKVIAAISEQPVIEKICTHLDLQDRELPRASLGRQLIGNFPAWT